MTRNHVWDASRWLMPVLSTILFVGTAQNIHAQVVAGSISGTVQDSTGGAVPSAEVKTTAAATGQVSTTKSDASGLFVIPFLRVGMYSVEVSKQGFKRSTVSNVEVTVNADHGLGIITLEVGQVTTMVEINAAPPLMETTQSQISKSITSTEITTFPGMDFAIGMDAMVYLIPGVAGTRGNNFANTDGAAFSVNGLRGRADDEQIDGANNNDNSVTGPGMFVQNPDFVQEYQFTTNDFSPEYGRNAGSVVNIISKSGSNVWHGDLFVTEGNNKLNTLSNTQKAFQGLHTLPKSNDEFSGGSVGGAPIKDKVFIFSGFDDQIIPGTGSVATGSLTPTPAGLQTLEACYPTSTALQALASYGPWGITGGNPTISGTPTTKTVTLTTSTAASSCTFQAAGIQRLFTNPYHQYDLFERLDVNGVKDRVYGRMMYQKESRIDASLSAVGYPYSEPSIGEQWGVSWTHTLSATMFNQFQLNYGRLGVQFGGNNIGNTIPATNNWANSLASITMPSGYASYGVATNLPQGRIVNTYQLQDNWSWVHGKHVFKAGTNLTYQRSPNVFPANFNGGYSFSSINNYIANIPTALSISIGNANLDFREHDSFWYFGDDFKVRPNLTLNMGLTYTYYGQPANLFNRLDTANESGSTPLYNPALPLSIRTFPTIPAPKTEFGPSFGFAYNPTWLGGAGKTTLRGGYRLAYDPPFYNIYLNIATAAPQVLAQTLSGSAALNVPLPAVPTGNNVRTLAAPFLVTGALDPRSVNETNVTPNFSADHVQMWSFGIQRQLAAHAVFETRYVGNHGGSQFQSIDGNPLVSGLLAAFPNSISGVTACPAASAVVSTAVGRVNCNEGVVRTRTNTGVSDYAGWQTELRTTNLWNQLTMSTSFTWSKTTDNTSEIFSSSAGGNTVAISQNPFDNLHAEHAISGQDLPASWTLTLYENLPMFRNQTGWLGRVMGGWAVSGTYRLQSGQPYTPSEEFLAGNTGATWMDTAFNNGFFTYPSINVRPFYGNPQAPVSLVGIYAGDACALKGGPTAASPDAACGFPATSLLNYNLWNTTDASSGLSTNAVRFIVNGKESETVYGTPFGNVPRNPVRDSKINLCNFSLYKTIKVTERVKTRLDVSLLNAFNHPNFSSVDPFLDDSGELNQSTGFGIPSLTSGGARTISLGLRVDF